MEVKAKHRCSWEHTTLTPEPPIAGQNIPRYFTGKPTWNFTRMLELVIKSATSCENRIAEHW